MLNIKDINRYFLRIAKLPERPNIGGQVVYLRHVSQQGIVVSMTDDCRPAPNMIRLSPASNDNGWYDVTELIMDANCAITPRYDMYSFVDETASQYRNHMEDSKLLHMCDGSQAMGQLCFIGRKNGEGFEFSRTAYFVVSVDDQGFYIVYSGFCEPRKSGRSHEILQRVLRLEGTGQHFYEAEPIVSACNAAYKGDCAMRDKYVANLKDRVAAASTSTTHAAAATRDSSLLTGMQLD